MNLNEVGWPEVWALQLSRGHTKVEKPESPDDPILCGRWVFMAELPSCLNDGLQNGVWNR